MVWFYRDFLDGPVYIIVVIFSIIFIMAIIGFIMERLQLEKEEKQKLAILKDSNPNNVQQVSSNITQSNGVDSSLEKSNDIDTTKTIIPASVIKKSKNAVTNDKIPAILDLNEIEKNEIL